MKHVVQVLGAALCAALLLAGCSNITLPTVKGNAVSSQVSSAKKPASSESSAAVPENTPSSQAGVSSGEEEGRGSGNEGTVNTVSTDSEAFDKKFRSNPIDMRYASEISTIMATRDIVQLSGRFADCWNKEITHVMAELKTKTESSDAEKWSRIQADQKKWEDGKDAAIEEIGKNAQAAGGSVAQVVTSSRVMEYYRARAAQLYRILFDYEPDFGYAYSD